MKRADPGKEPWLIAIVGGSGAGKTWLTEQLRTRFGKEAACLCLDDFFRDWAHLPLGRRARLNFDHPRMIDWVVLEDVLQRGKAGVGLQVPCYDFESHTRCLGLRPWKPQPLIVVEGLWLLWRPQIRRLFTFSVFIECPQETRLQRRINRDVAERGREEASVRKQFRSSVAPMHHRYVAPQKRWANLVLTSPIGPNEVEQLVALLRERCRRGEGQRPRA